MPKKKKIVIKNTGVGVAAVRSGARTSMRCGTRQDKRGQRKKPNAGKPEIILPNGISATAKLRNGAIFFINEAGQLSQEAFVFETEDQVKAAISMAQLDIPAILSTTIHSL